MANHTPFIVAMILLTSLLLCCSTGQANEPDPNNTSIGRAEQIVQDTIAITIAEEARAKAFLNSFLKLASLGNIISMPNTDKVVQYVGGLCDAMNNVSMELQKLEDSLLNYNTSSLEHVVHDVLSFNFISYDALENVDGTIKHMILRKIEDIVLLTYDVIFRVGVLHLDAKVTWKP